MNEDCGLSNMFDDVREWLEGETYDDRLVWIECFGINPKGWTTKTLQV